MTVSTEPGAPTEAPVDDVTPGRGKRGLVWVVVALLVGAVLGLGAGLVIPHFTKPGDTSVEAGFLRDMSTHHAQAVEMSMIAHADSANPEIVSLAGDIALTQHGQ